LAFCRPMLARMFDVSTSASLAGNVLELKEVRF
jgi:hypothetical protein